jgi:hypothetical protein
MRYPSWPLKKEVTPEPEHIARLRTTAEDNQTVPASVWRETFLVTLARLDASSYPEVKRHATILFEELWELSNAGTLDSRRFYEEQLDRMRRLDLARARAPGQDLLAPFTRCQQLRRLLENLDPWRNLEKAKAKNVLLPLWKVALGDAPAAGAFSKDIRDDLIEELQRTKSATRAAIILVARAQLKSPDSLHSLFTRWKLDPGSDDMFEVIARDPAREPQYVDFEVAPRRSRLTNPI